MQLPREWPEQVREAVTNLVGSPIAVEPVSGIAQTRTSRVRSHTGCVIVKWSNNPAESRFYETAASALAEQGIPTPRLLWSHHTDDSHWIIVEHVPHPLPRDRWLADPEILSVLRRLHNLDLNLSVSVPDHYVPRWTEEMTDAALSLLPDKQADLLRSRLIAIQEESQRLFDPLALISGDPNPTNWGIRDDGRLVLFDWERVTYAAPALDLAITIPGLGDATAFSLVASRYLDQSTVDHPEVSSSDLAASIAIAKAWSVTEFLSQIAGSTNYDSNVARIIAALPGWLTTAMPEHRI